MSISNASRCVPSGAHARGNETRRRMIEAAIDAFALHGYEGASTRLLAEKAGVNLPAIQYHFGSKEGLYGAVVDVIIQQITERMAPAATRAATESAKGDLPPARLRALLNQLLDDFLTLTINAPDRFKPFFYRAQIENATTALEPIRDAVRQHVVVPCTVLIARLIDRAADDELTIARTWLVLGQVTVFGQGRVLREIGWDDLCEERLSTIRKLVHEHTAAILRAARRTPR